MTENKPIMIDGVNVAGCEFHSSTPSSELCYMKGNKCNDNSNCYFKQHARKTQECEYWKHQAELGSDTTDRLTKQLEEKEQECEELREYHNKCCQEFKKEKQDLINKYNQLSRDFYSGKYCNVEKCKQFDKLKAENEEYKKKFQKFFNINNEECWNAAFLQDGKEQAEQKLVRIGDIAEKDINFCLKCNGGKEIDCIDCIEGGRALLAKEILQIIDEVE